MKSREGRSRPGAAPVVLILALLPAPLAARAPQAAAAGDSIRAMRIDPDAGDRVELDGRLTEGFWTRAPLIDDFRQREPEEGTPATERTEVRVAYDDDNLYVGIDAFDSRPDLVVARLLQRDRVMSRHGFGGIGFQGDDGVAILLDAFHDHRNAVIFATNPNGAEYDALLTDEGNQFNVDWRGVWRVASARTDHGWSTEFAIPWRTLRYPPDAVGRVWGFNVFRVIQRKKEEVLWRSWSREGGGFDRVSQAGHLLGLAGLPRNGLNVEAKPFALAGRTQRRNEAGSLEGQGRTDMGLDLKSEIRPGLVLDLTANTDFAQVEVDDQQVNLTRFSLFFPEKRDFFLENSGIFEFGKQGYMGGPPYLMFFSRNIGIGPGGEVPIIGGGRLTGRIGGQTVGLLSVATDAAHGRNGETFNVFRLKRDVGSNNYVGAMLTDRRGAGPVNTVVGVDSRVYLHPTLVFDAFVAKSYTRGAGGDGVAFDATLDFTADLYGGFLEHSMIGREAVAAAGFINRKDIRKTSINLRRRIRPDFIGLRLNDFRFNGDYQSTTDGRFQDWTAGLSSGPTWNAGDNGTISWAAGETQVDFDFVLADTVPVPAGRYRTDNWRFNYSSSSSRPWVVSASHSRSKFYGGTLRSWSASLAWTPVPAISVAPSFSRNDVSLPNGAFTADILGFRAIWALSTKVTTNALIQYNRLSDDFVSNIRFNFIHRPGSDLYVVFTEQRGVEDDPWRLADRGVVVKLTYLFRF